jgi:Na+-driven multidrug efflux pump
MVGFMVFFAIEDTSQVMMSQNFGAKNIKRMDEFFRVAAFNVLVTSVLCIFLLLFFNESLIFVFLPDEGNGKALALATEFNEYVWPLFIFAGVNMLISIRRRGVVSQPYLPIFTANWLVFLSIGLSFYLCLGNW